MNEVHRLAPVFTWAEAKSAGMSSRQARHTAMRVTRGIYAKDPMDLRLRIQSILLIAGAKAAITGVTALQLAGVDLPARLARDTRIWVQVPYSQHWPCRGEVRLVRPKQAAPVVTMRQLPCVRLPYCWLHLAGECTIDELVELADAMIRRQNPVTSMRQMEHDAARRRYLEDHGWRLITVTSADLVKNPLGVIDSVRRALASADRRLT